MKEHLVGYAALLQEPDAPVSVLLHRADAEALLGPLPEAPKEAGNFWVHYVRSAPKASRKSIHDPLRGKNLIGKMFQCLSWRSGTWLPDTPGAHAAEQIRYHRVADESAYFELGDEDNFVTLPRQMKDEISKNFEKVLEKEVYGNVTQDRREREKRKKAMDDRWPTEFLSEAATPDLFRRFRMKNDTVLQLSWQPHTGAAAETDWHRTVLKKQPLVVQGAFVGDPTVWTLTAAVQHNAGRYFAFQVDKPETGYELMDSDLIRTCPTRLVRDTKQHWWITNSAVLGDGLRQNLGWRLLAQQLAQADDLDYQYFEEVTREPEQLGDFYPVRSQLPTVPETEELDADLPEDKEEPDLPDVAAADPNFTPSKQQLHDLMAAHDNYGHPTNVRLSRWLRLGRCQPEICRWVRDHLRCDQCEAEKGPKPNTPTSIPRSYRANHVVGTDHLYVENTTKKKRAWSNTICWGTAFQQVVRVQGVDHEGPPDAAQAWAAFVDGWLRWLGPPEILIHDQGNEYKAEFASNAASSGITMIPINKQAPWENGRTEHAGYEFKNNLAKARRTDPPRNEMELDSLAGSVVAARNRWFHRAGFAPLQRIFGFSPRLPNSVLADDLLDRELLSQDQTTDFRRSEELRRAATAAVAQSDARTGLHKVSRVRHRLQVQYSEGDLVYVWRDSRIGKGWWRGPGIVMLAKGNTVWVHIRGALWKCARSQLRQATSEENLGAELVNRYAVSLREAYSNRGRRGYVDVEREGPPPENAGEDEPPPLGEPEDEGEPEQRASSSQEARAATEVSTQEPVSEASAQGDVVSDTPVSTPRAARPAETELEEGVEKARRTDDPPSRTRQAETELEVSLGKARKLDGHPPVYGLRGPGSAYLQHADPEVEPLTAQQRADVKLYEMLQQREWNPSQRKLEGVTDVYSDTVSDGPLYEAAREAVIAAGLVPRRRFQFNKFSLDGQKFMPPHRDTKNGGESYGRIFGKFRGAALIFESGAVYQGPTPWFKFDPKDKHWVTELEDGERHSVVNFDFIDDLQDHEPTQDEMFNFFNEGGWNYFEKEAPDVQFKATDAFAVFERDGFYIRKKAPGAELDVRSLDPAEQQKFTKVGGSRSTEMMGLRDRYKAISFLDVNQTQKIRREKRERIMRSRYIEKMKDMGPGEQDIAKSRWCVLGFEDPDILKLKRTCPTPESDSVLLQAQVLASTKSDAFIGDLEKGFAQGLKKQRDEPLYAEAPPGGWCIPELEGKDVIARLETEMYGLVSGPNNLRRTLKTELKSFDYLQHPMEACQFIYFEPGARYASGWLLLETDDIFGGGCSPGFWRSVEGLKKKLNFGKFKDPSKAPVDYGGRTMTYKNYTFEFSMHRYVEKLRPVEIDRSRVQRGEKDASEYEVTGFRTSVAALAWATREGRPDGAGEASLSAQKLPQPTKDDIKILNDAIRDVKANNTVTIKVKPIPIKDLIGYVYVDASKDNAEGGKSQTAYLLGAADKRVLEGIEVDASVWSWRSRASPRACSATLMSEAYALTYGLAAAEWSTSQFYMSYDKEFKLQDRQTHLKEIKIQTLMNEPDHKEIKLVGIMDAKSLYDNLMKEATNQGEKRAALEVVIARESLEIMQGMPRWIPHEENITDAMTKLKSNKRPLMKFLKEGRLKLLPEAEVLAERAKYREDTGKCNPRPKHKS